MSEAIHSILLKNGLMYGIGDPIDDTGQYLPISDIALNHELVYLPTRFWLFRWWSYLSRVGPGKIYTVRFPRAEKPELHGHVHIPVRDVQNVFYN